MTVYVWFESHNGERDDFGECSYWPSTNDAVDDLLETGALVVRNKAGDDVRDITPEELKKLRETGCWSYAVHDEYGDCVGHHSTNISEAKYFTKDFDVNNPREVLRWLKEDFDGDRWGWAMSVALDIAAELYNRGGSVPFDSYRPGACTMQPVSEYRAEGMAEIPAETLYTVGLVIDRYLDKLKLAGVDY